MSRPKFLSFGGAVTALAGLVLVLAAFLSAPALADSQHGDIWTQPGGTAEETSGHSQEVHLPCGNVDVWGDYLAHGAGSFTVYSWPPSAQSHVSAYQGAYTFTAEGSQKIGTVPQSVFQGVYGPHYKIQVDQDNSKFKTFWVTCPGQLVTPTLTTTPNPTSAVVGTLLKDTAHLTDGNQPGGRINFKLYAPGESAARDAESVVVNGNGDYTTPAGYTADKLGTWYWVASYTGDDSANHPVTTGPQDEPVVVGKATPGLTTTPSQGGVEGKSITDSATLTGGYGTLQGSITFKLYNGAGQLANTWDPVPVDGAGTYSTPSAFVASTAGTWHWVAEYSGDSFNNGVVSGATDEPVVITAPEQPNKATPTLTTTTNPSSGTVGVALNDTAHLAGGSAPTGTLTFTLYKPDDTVAYQEQVTVATGNGDYSTVHGFTSNAVGTWHWVAGYSGDANNNAVASLKADEPVTVAAAATVNPTGTPTPGGTATPTGAVGGEQLAATGTPNWPLDLGMSLIVLGGLALAMGLGVIWIRRWES